MHNSISEKDARWLLIAAAWAVILAISDFPRIILQSITTDAHTWLPWGKVVFTLLFLSICLVWQRLRPLISFSLLMLAFCLGLALSETVRISSWWVSWLQDEKPTFLLGYIKPFMLDISLAFVVLVTLWLIHRSPTKFFLAKGGMSAPIEPVPWLGIGRGESWKTFGWIFTLIATLAVAIPTFLGLGFPQNGFSRFLPFMPAILLLSAINAFNEEIYYRATLLSTLPQVIGKNHALLLNAALFGLAHYFGGSPPGILGVLMTGFLGWLLGKAMLETRGLAWSWIMHFVPDVVIFTSYALAWLPTD